MLYIKFTKLSLLVTGNYSNSNARNDKSQYFKLLVHCSSSCDEGHYHCQNSKPSSKLVVNPSMS